MKMSDVFTVPVYSDFQDVNIINRSKPCIVSGTSTVLVARQKYIDAAIHAINNHDRLVEENKRLREFVKRVADGDTACTLLRQYMVHSYIHSAVKILEELEGGEDDK